MKISFATTANEEAELAKFVRSRFEVERPRLIQQLLAVMTGFSISSWLVLLYILLSHRSTFRNFPSSTTAQVLVCLAIAFAIEWSLWLIERSKEKQLQRRISEALAGPTSIELDGERLKISHSGTTIDVARNELHAVLEHGGAIYLLVTPIVVFVVPARAFETVAAKEFFGTAVTGTVDPTIDMEPQA